MIQFSRLISKKLAISGATPSIPLSDNHMDGSWRFTDLYVGEFCINIIDDKVWYRSENGIIEIGMTGPSGSSGTSGINGSSGSTGISGSSGSSGTSGTSGETGSSGIAGSSGTSGTGTSGTSGTSAGAVSDLDFVLLTSSIYLLNVKR